jgi:molecular chaperone DnaK
MGGVMTKLIERNTTIPTRKSQIFSTAADSQTSVEIHILQGEREMADGNRTLGRFTLDGIPPAPRGVPQVEVTFDIDANGIVNVSAKDKASGKEQKISITGSSGLSSDEVDRMVKEAQKHADEDKKRRELVDTKNQAEGLIAQTEKSLKEYGDKLEAADKSAIEDKVTSLKKLIEDSASIEALKTGIQELSQASVKIGEIMYKAAQAESGNANASDGDGASSAKTDNVVDAEFEESK